jgi:hypothetical protein
MRHYLVRKGTRKEVGMHSSNLLQDEEVGWLQDRASLLAYRLAAAWCGLMIRLTRPFADAIGLIGLGLTVFGLALVVRYGPFLRVLAIAAERRPLITYTSGALIIAAVLWLMIRYLGNLSMIMRVAASSSLGAEKIRQQMAEGMQNAHAYAQICRLYKDPVEAANKQLRKEGWQEGFEPVRIGDPIHESHDYAAIALPLTEPVRLENLLEAIGSNAPEKYQEFSKTAENRQALMRKWREGGTAARRIVGDEEGFNYHLLAIRVKNESGPPRLALDVGVATYGQIVRTCDALINEFALYAYITRSRRPRMRTKTFLHCLPWRRKIHEQEKTPEDIFLSPRERAAGLGIAVATVLAEEGDYVVALGMRSHEVGTYPDCLHVIPAGMCNTRDSNEDRGTKRSTVPDWFVRTTMRSEFQEEWYSDKDLEEGRITHWRPYVDENWEERIGDKPIMLTGFAYDLLNLRPEICGVVVVDRWGDKLCWEYLQGQPHEERFLTKVGSVEATHFVQAGVAALLLAQQALLDNVTPSRRSSRG